MVEACEQMDAWHHPAVSAPVELLIRPRAVDGHVNEPILPGNCEPEPDWQNVHTRLSEPFLMTTCLLQHGKAQSDAHTNRQHKCLQLLHLPHPSTVSATFDPASAASSMRPKPWMAYLAASAAKRGR